MDKYIALNCLQDLSRRIHVYVSFLKLRVHDPKHTAVRTTGITRTVKSCLKFHIVLQKKRVMRIIDNSKSSLGEWWLVSCFLWEMAKFYNSALYK